MFRWLTKIKSVDRVELLIKSVESFITGLAAELVSEHQYIKNHFSEEWILITRK